MPPKLQAKRDAFRAFVAVLKPMLAKYGVRGGETVQRDGAHDVALKLYKKLLLKVHPDKGGDENDFKRIQEVKEAFDAASVGHGSVPGRRSTGSRTTRAAGPGGAGAAGSAHPAPDCFVLEAQGLCEFCGEDSSSFRVQAKAVLLTYNGVSDWDTWVAFKSAVGAKLRDWRVKYYGSRGVVQEVFSAGPPLPSIQKWVQACRMWIIQRVVDLTGMSCSRGFSRNGTTWTCHLEVVLCQFISGSRFAPCSSSWSIHLWLKSSRRAETAACIL